MRVIKKNISLNRFSIKVPSTMSQTITMVVNLQESEVELVSQAGPGVAHTALHFVYLYYADLLAASLRGRRPLNLSLD